MRASFQLFLPLLPVLCALGCGRGDDEGYCIGPYGASLDLWGVHEYEGTGCVWADKRSCDDAGGDWIDWGLTEFTGEGEQGLAGYCASEGYAVACRGEQEYLESADGCPEFSAG